MAEKAKVYDSPEQSGNAGGTPADRVKVYEQKKSGSSMWMWLLPLLLIIGIGWWLLSRNNDTRAATPQSLGLVNFNTDQATLTPDSQATLDRAAVLMKQNPNMRVRVQGFTDSTGDAAHNVALSNQRSEAVTGYLVARGIDRSRLSAEGFGDSNPAATNATASGKANNRRVELFQQ